MRSRTPLRRLGVAALCVLSGAVVLSAGSPPAQAGTGTPTFANYAAPTSLPDYNNAGEPSVGVDWKTGATMYQAYNSTYKVAFNDATIPATATWANASGSVLINADPILYTDSSVGRTFAGGEAANCSSMNYSDNDGTSWTTMTNACAGSDHETVGAGAWASKPLLATYDRAVYYCAQQDVSDLCSVSSDGGKTFGAPVSAGNTCSSLHGHVKVSADGTAYLPNANCGTGAQPGGGVTRNSGSSWSGYVIPGTTNPSNSFDPSVATTPNNTVYEAWADGSNHPTVAQSADHGSTWTRITDLSTTMNPPIVTSTFQTAVAGDNGRVAVSYLGSTTSGNPFAAGWHGVWDLYTSFTYDGGVTWTTVKVTSDPVQRGWMCSSGVSCTSGRNLLDFIDSSVTKDGRVVVGYADGCIDTCASSSGTEAQSTSASATIARQSTGKGLFAAYDASGPSAPSAPTLSATASNGQVALSWTTPASGGSAITGYKLYRGTTAGGETLLTTTSATSYTDTAVTNGTGYYYRASAVNAVGEGALSNEVSATPAANQSPTACFTHTDSGLATSTNGGCSSDPDGSVASYSWNWGDGSAAGSGATASHTYATAGTYTVTLTVTDNAGATGSTSQSVTASGDPDPSTPTLTSGVATSGTTAAQSGTWNYYKIQVPAGSSQLKVTLAGPSCGILGCSPDLDLYVKAAAKPTTSSYNGSSATNSNSETVTLSSPGAAWYYVGVYVYSGSSSVGFTVTATVS